MRGKKTAARIFFGLYCAGMLVLLFHRALPEGLQSHWQQAQKQLNLIPGHTIALYWRLLGRPDPRLVRLAVINLAGNVVMFLPLGGVLPELFRVRWRFGKTLLVSALAITAVEILQLLTLRGTCDIDDLILNLLGVILGYGLCFRKNPGTQQTEDPKT